MRAAVYVRFLRSLIAEICCPFSIARRCNQRLLDIWDHVEVDLMSWYDSVRSTPFERLSLLQRRDVLRIIGFLLRDLPMSLASWQATTSNSQAERKQLPCAIVRTFYDQGFYSVAGAKYESCLY